MVSDLRAFLYLPLGILPTILFALRFFFYWRMLEKKQKSGYRVFWKISLCGNGLMALHYFVQVQFPFSLFQALNGFIAYRNLRLMDGADAYGVKKRIIAVILVLTLVLFSFLVQSILFIGWIDWIRTPKLFPTLLQPEKYSLAFHLFGSLSNALFACRFWFQWWLAEENGSSTIPVMFWYLSIGGSLLSLVYFSLLFDFVSSLQYSAQLFPYIRFLILSKRPLCSKKNQPILINRSQEQVA